MENIFFLNFKKKLFIILFVIQKEKLLLIHFLRLIIQSLILNILQLNQLKNMLLNYLEEEDVQKIHLVKDIWLDVLKIIIFI